MASGLAYLQSLSLWDRTTLFSTENPARILAALGNPQDSFQAVHVAGTNGKGSVCAFLAAMFHADGHSVGQFASPHLSEVTERCLLDGKPVSEEEFGRQIDRAVEAAQSVDTPLSYFELCAIASFLVFAERQVDWAVIEVGLGGRLDATNTMRAPKATVVTSIGYDHTHILGETLEEIAREKAGIFRAGVPAFAGFVDSGVEAALLEEARKVEAPIEFVRGDLEGEFSSRVPAMHQRQNLQLASRVAAYLGVSADGVERGARNARWPGRLEWIAPRTEGGPEMLLDVAHNPVGIEVLVKYLEDVLSQRPNISRLVFVLSILSRKDWRAMLETLLGLRARFSQREIGFVLTDCGHRLACPPEEMQEVVADAVLEPNPVDAVKQAAEMAGSTGLVVVTGSIYLVGALRKEIADTEFCTIAAKNIK